MKNYVAKGETVTVVAPADKASGEGVLVGSLFGVAVRDALMGEGVPVVTTGIVDLPKEAALAIDQGDLVYWDDTAGECDKTDTNTLIGVCTVDAADSADEVRVRLNGAWTA